jgi:hypothetical protein
MSVVVKFTFAHIVEAKHKKPIQEGQFVMGMHAADELVALPVLQAFQCSLLKLKLDDMEFAAHWFASRSARFSKSASSSAWALTLGGQMSSGPSSSPDEASSNLCRTARKSVKGSLLLIRHYIPADELGGEAHRTAALELWQVYTR